MLRTIVALVMATIISSAGEVDVKCQAPQKSSNMAVVWSAKQFSLIVIGEDFNKENMGEIKKFIFTDFDGGCVYAVQEKVFLLTENTDTSIVTCYAVCVIDDAYTPTAVTTTGNYMIFQDEEGNTIAAPMKKIEGVVMSQVMMIKPEKTVAFDELEEREKALFRLIEEK